MYVDLRTMMATFRRPTASRPIGADARYYDWLVQAAVHELENPYDFLEGIVDKRELFIKLCYEIAKDDVDGLDICGREHFRDRVCHAHANADLPELLFKSARHGHRPRRRTHGTNECERLFHMLDVEVWYV